MKQQQHTRGKTLNDEQVENHIREWNEKADAMEKMSVEEARRFVSGSQPNTSNFFAMTLNMQHKIRKEAPSKDAEKRMLKAWERRTRAYQKIMAMIDAAVRPLRQSTTTPTSQFHSCMQQRYNRSTWV